MFSSCVRSIEDEYERLGHSLGWRFLYSPMRTLDPAAPLLLAGCNPGGSHPEPPLSSVEAGNAFRLERWPGSGSGHQDEVLAMLAGICTELYPGTSASGFVDGTLTTNFCPFRSPSLPALVSRRLSLDFSRLLWVNIFDQVLPPAIICNGVITAELFEEALLKMGFRAGERIRYPTGWGQYNYWVMPVRRANHVVTLFALPHLGRFRFIRRDPVVAAALARRVAEAVSQRSA